MSLRTLLRAAPVDGTLTLDSYPTDVTPLVDGKGEAKHELDGLGERLFASSRPTKWYRNWAIATILVETLDDMDLSYPQPDLDRDALMEALDD